MSTTKRIASALSALAPKVTPRQPSAYNLFMKTESKNLSNISNKERMQSIAERWKSLDAMEKEELAEAAKAHTATSTKSPRPITIALDKVDAVSEKLSKVATASFVHDIVAEMGETGTSQVRGLGRFHVDESGKISFVASRSLAGKFEKTD